MIVVVTLLTSTFAVAAKWQASLIFLYALVPAYIFISLIAPLYRLFTILHAEEKGFLVNVIWCVLVATGFYVSSVNDWLYIGIVIFVLISAVRFFVLLALHVELISNVEERRSPQ